MPRMADAVIFDMDGVLVDSEVHWKELESDHIREMVPSWQDSDYEQIVGLSVNDLYGYIEHKYSIPFTFDEFLIKHLALASRIYREKVNLLPGVMELLTLLHDSGIPIGLASSSPQAWIDMVLDRFAIRRFFMAVVSAEHLGGRGKPLPDVYLHALKLLNVKPESCLAVEDSRNGVLSAVKAGMYCAGLKNGFNQEQDLSGSDVIVGSLSEISRFCHIK